MENVSENKNVSVNEWLSMRKTELLKTVEAIRAELREKPELFGLYFEALSEIRGALKLIGELEVGLNGNQQESKGE